MPLIYGEDLCVKDEMTPYRRYDIMVMQVMSGRMDLENPVEGGRPDEWI